MSIKPKLRIFDLTMLMVSLVIGMGIFRSPVEVALKAQMPSIFFLAWVMGGFISFCGALTFAEIGSRYPAAGGFYKIFSHCYHPAFAFMVNWISIIANAASAAIVAIIGAEYINPIILPDVAHDLGIKLTTITGILILFVINMLGIKMSVKTLNLLMAIKIALIILIIISIFFAPESATPLSYSSVNITGTEYVKAFWLCFVPVFFTYGGYHQTINFGGDIPDASRAMPKAILSGIAIILVLYLLVNLAYVKVLGFEGLQQSTTIVSDMADKIFGPNAYKITAVIMFLSVMAYVNSSMLSNPRVYYAMAEDRVLPAIFKRVNEKTQVQEFAVTIFVSIMIITLFLTASFSRVLNYIMFFDSIGLSAAAASLFILRYRAKRSEGPPPAFKMLGYPIIPALFILAYMSVTISVMISNPMSSFIGLLLFLSGIPLYYILKKLIH